MVVIILDRLVLIGSAKNEWLLFCPAVLWE